MKNLRTILAEEGLLKRRLRVSGSKTAGRSEDGEVKLRRPIFIDGEGYTEAYYEITERSILIELSSSSGVDTPSATKREDLSDPQYFDAAIDDVSSSLRKGELPDGFSKHDF